MLRVLKSSLPLFVVVADGCSPQTSAGLRSGSESAALPGAQMAGAGLGVAEQELGVDRTGPSRFLQVSAQESAARPSGDTRGLLGGGGSQGVDRSYPGCSGVPQGSMLAKAQTQLFRRLYLKPVT